MTPMEKAEKALNRRIEQFQAKLPDADSEGARRALVQGIVIYAAIGQAIGTYVQAIGHYAKSRFGELKQDQAALTAEHEALLKSGRELLEQLKANPTDRALRKEIERTQRKMETLQKTLRRGADALQRDVSPGVRLVDQLADGLRRLAEAEDREGLKRAAKILIENVEELYRLHPALPSSGLIDAAVWTASVVTMIDEAADLYDAHARAGVQTVLGLELATLAMSDSPPQSAEDALHRANAAVAQRLAAIAARLSGGAPPSPSEN